MSNVVEFPEIEQIGGGLTMNFNDNLNLVDFSSLNTTGTVDVAGLFGLQRLSFPALTAIEGSLFLVEGRDLEDLHLPVLQNLNGAFLIESHPKLPLVDLPALQRVQQYHLPYYLNILF